MFSGSSNTVRPTVSASGLGQPKCRSPPEKQLKGVDMAADTRLREGMSLEEGRRLLAPARVARTLRGRGPTANTRYFQVTSGKNPRAEAFLLLFDEDDRLYWPELPGGGTSKGEYSAPQAR